MQSDSPNRSWSRAALTFFGVAALCLSPATSRAGEGFWTSNAPGGVRAAWSSTFAILTDLPTQYDVGTASLVYKRKTQDAQELYFLTANHAIAPQCQVGRICTGTYLVQDLKGKSEGTKMTVEPLRQPLFERVEVLERYPEADLALLRVYAEASATNLPPPLKLPTKCEFNPGDELFAIGYPGTADRTNPRSQPIEEPDRILKRWSRGLFVGYRHDDQRRYQATTVDALKGNSGGPILTSDGTLVGVALQVSDRIKTDGFRYDGNETPGHLEWHLLGTRCDDLLSLPEHLVETYGTEGRD